MNIFCSLPFNSIHVSNGSAMPCCAFVPNTKIPLRAYINNKELLDVKSNLLNGKFPKQCGKCELNEKLNNASFRMLNNQFDSEEELIRKVGVSYHKIKYLTIVTSNICNLKCLPCLYCSYVRIQELEQLNLRPGLKVLTLDEITMQEIDEVLKMDSLERISLLGGEPFLDKVTFNLIDSLIEKGIAKNITLDINTNLTIITEDKLEKIQKNFKNVYLKGSIDGFGIANEYLRYPSDWKDIVESVKLIKKMNFDFAITTAMSNLALLKYYELVEWAMDSQIIDMYQTVVLNVPALIPTNLPTEIKQDLLTKYKKIKNYSLSDRTEMVIDSCVSICQSTRPHVIGNTVEYLKKHDEHRGTDYSKIWPELKAYEQT